MSVPLVSVIMTAYNCEKYIKESLESIIFQTFKDFEIIIYDDASTDKTWQLAVELLKNSNCVYRMSNGKKNMGCGEGRNIAIKEAIGKYIAIQDADDISFRTRLEKEVKFLEENDDIFCVGAWADKMEEDGKFIELMTYPLTTHEEVYDDIVVKRHNNIIDPSCMYRREDFNKLGGYYGKWMLVPDFNLWARAAKAGLKFANLQEVLVHYRQHPNSVTNKSRTAVDREHFKMCRELF
jgi:glycosyltransferase EpsE